MTITPLYNEDGKVAGTTVELAIVPENSPVVTIEN